MKKGISKKLMALGLVLTMLFCMMGCGSKSTETSEAEEKTEEAATPEEEKEAATDEKITVGVNLFYMRDEYYVDLENTFRTYGAELGYDIVITDADADVPTQVSQVEDFITQGVDIILISATDPDALIAPIQEAIDSGIPVICFDGTINSDIPATKVIFDFYASGVTVGEWAVEYIKENLGGTAKVAVLDFPASPIVCGQRTQGFIDTVSALEGVEIVAQQDGKASRTESMSVMENILTANPDIDLVYGVNYDTAAGAAAAIEAANATAVTCCDGWGKEFFEQLESNHPIMKAGAASSPVTQAKDALDAVAPALAGEELPKETLSYSTLLTSENIKDFDWQSIIDARE